jgi:hypothetical protein
MGYLEKSMNEKIRELALQATIRKFDGTGADMGKLVLDEQKFGELIVRECAELIIETGTDWVDFAPSQTGVRSEYWALAQQIKQHFGVNE